MNNRLPLLIALLTLAATVHGDDAPWYQVEVIIFEQQDEFGDEGTRADIELAYPEPRAFLMDTDEIAEREAARLEAETTSRPPAPLDRLLIPPEKRQRPPSEHPFVPLPRGERGLNPDAYTLERNGSYRVLFHQAWRQPAEDSGGAPWVVITGGDRFGEQRELAGSVRFYHSRHPHFQVNLWWVTFGAPLFGGDTLALPSPWPTLPARPEPPPPVAPSVATTLFDTDGLPRIQAQKRDDAARTFAAPATRIQYPVEAIDLMRQSHRIDTRQIHYFDHPRLGVLVRVTPYTPLDRALN